MIVGCGFDIYSDRVYATDLSGNAEVIAEVAGHPSGLGWTAGNKLLVVSVLERRVLRMEDGLLQCAESSRSLDHGIGLLAGLAAPAFAQTAAQHPSNPQTRSTGGADMSCPGDKVVWVNTKSRIYHFQGERWFGNTQQGRYMCDHAAAAEGDRPTHNGQ
jgi:hypothetical protein